MKYKLMSAIMAFSMLVSSTIAPLAASKSYASADVEQNTSIMNKSTNEVKDDEKPAETSDTQLDIPEKTEEVKEQTPVDTKTEEQQSEIQVEREEETNKEATSDTPQIETEEIEEIEKIVKKSDSATLYEDSSYTKLSSEDIDIKITGNMPENGTIKAYEIQNAITDMEKENVLAFGFEIFDKDDNLYDKSSNDEYKIEIKSSKLRDLDKVYFYKKDEADLRFTEINDFSKLSNQIKLDSKADEFAVAKDIEKEEEETLTNQVKDKEVKSPFITNQDNEEELNNELSKEKEVEDPKDILDSLTSSINQKEIPATINENPNPTNNLELIDWKKDFLDVIAGNLKADKSDKEETIKKSSDTEEDSESKNKSEELPKGENFEEIKAEAESKEEDSKENPQSTIDNESESKEDYEESEEKSETNKLEEEKTEEKLTYQQVLADIYTDKTYSQKSNDGTRIKLSGNLPGYTKVKAYPVEIEIEGKEILAAYDITIFDENNKEYKVSEKNDINVQITNQKIKEAKEVEIYHKENEAAPEEKVEVKNKNRDTVTFKADSFSIYAVTDPKAQATRTYEFYVRNADGTLKLINTQTIRSGEMLQKPPVPILEDRGRYAGWFPIGEDKVEHGSNEVHFFTPITFDTKIPVTIKAEPLFLDNVYIDFKERVYITEENKKDFPIPADYKLSSDGYYRNSAGKRLYRDEVFKTRVQDFDKAIGEAHIPVIKDEAPIDPNKPNPVLSYWSINPEGGPIFDFKNTKISRDLIKEQEKISGEQQLTRLDLFAIYEEGYTVSFDSQGGSHVTKQIVKKGDTLNLDKLIDPIKPGYKFIGWSLTPNGPVLTDLKTRVISHTKTLYAVYEQLPGTYTVSHYTENINDSNYTFYKSEKKSAQVGSKTPDGEYFRNSRNSPIAADLNSKGYTKPTDIVPSDSAKIVKGDGSTDIKVYHRRPRYKLNVYTTGDLQLRARFRFTEELKEGQDTSPVWKRAERLVGDRYEVRDGSLSGDTLKTPKDMPAREWNLYFVPTLGNEEWFVKFIEVDANDQPMRDENGNLKVFKTEAHNAIISGLEVYNGGAEVPGFIFRYVTEPGKNSDSPKVYANGEPREVRTFYRRLSYTLTFKTNNVLYPDKNQKVPYYTPIKSYVPTTITPGTIDKNGAIFKGWYDNPDFTGVPVDFTNIRMPAKDTTYHGKWVQEKYNVRVYKEMTTPGQSVGPGKMDEFQVDRNTKLSKDDPRLTAIKPEKIKNEKDVKLTWYRFSGFQFEPYDFNEPITSDLFLYPVWSYFDPVSNTYRPLEDVHRIKYSDGTNSFMDQNLYLNNAAAIIKSPYALKNVDRLEDPENLDNTYFGNLQVPKGKHFQGWLLNSPEYNQSTRIYRPGEVVNVTSDMTFYPKWGEYDKTQITLYEQKPGTDKNISTTEKMRENGTIKLPTPTAQNYIFEGWSKTTSGNVDFKGGQEVMVTNENLPNQLYGIWKANRTINIHEEQPVGTKNTYTKENVSDGTFTIPEPNKIDGYTFMGWSTKPNDKTISYKPGQTINVSENNPLPTDIYGVWEKEKLKLTATFNLQNVQKDKLKYTITITKPVALENDNTLLAKLINTSFAAEMIDSGTTTVELANGESTTFPNIEPGSTIEITQETLPKVVTSYSVNGANPVEGNTATVTAGTENVNVVFYNEDVPPSVRLHTNYGSINYDDLRDQAGNPITPGVDDKTLVRNLPDAGSLTYRNLYKSVNELIPLGFSLKGWAESPNGPLKYDYYDRNNPTYNELGDKDLYAVWYNPVKIIVDLEVDDGEKINLPITVNYDGYQESDEFNLSQSNSFEKIAPTNTNIDSVVFETPKYYTSQIVEHVEEETEDYYVLRRTIKLTRDTPPVPTGLIDDIAPMALMLALASMAFAYRLYKRNKLAGGIDE